MSAGGSNDEVTSTGRPSAAIDRAAASRMSTTWAACAADARWGRASAIAAARSATPRAQEIPLNGSRTWGTGA